jgi:hypothetical protein
MNVPHDSQARVRRMTRPNLSGNLFPSSFSTNYSFKIQLSTACRTLRRENDRSHSSSANEICHEGERENDRQKKYEDNGRARGKNAVLSQPAKAWKYERLHHLTPRSRSVTRRRRSPIESRCGIAGFTASGLLAALLASSR